MSPLDFLESEFRPDKAMDINFVSCEVSRLTTGDIDNERKLIQ